jgi:hypothetical protein
MSATATPYVPNLTHPEPPAAGYFPNPGGNYSGDYSGVAPTFSPTSIGGVARDSVTGDIWWWDGTSWVQ